jgi:hypothetical protein
MARNTVRRDHNISPSESSKTRQAPRMNDDEGAGRPAAIAVEERVPSGVEELIASPDT